MSKDLDPDFCNLSATPPSSLEDSPTSTAVPPEKRKKIVFIQPGQPRTSVPISIPATSTRIPQITRTIEPRASSSNEPTVPTKQSKLILARTIPTTSVPQRKLSTQPRITTKVPEKSSLPLPMNVAQHTHKKVILVGRKVPTKSSLGIQQTTTAIPSVQQPSSRNPNQPTRKVPERFVYQPLKQQPTSALKKVPPTTSLPVQPTTLTSTVVQPRAMPQPTKPLPTEPLPPEPLPTEPLPAEPQPPTINSKLDAIMRQLDGLQMSVENLDKRSRRIEKSVGLVQVTTDQVKNCVCNRVLQAHQEEEFEFELLNNVEELKEFNEKLSDPQYEVKIFTWANGRIASEAPETRMQEALNFLFTKELLAQCSWTGGGRPVKKFPFRELRRVVKLFKMIGSNRFYAINETMVANFIGKKLRYAPDQVKAEKTRKATNPSCLDVEENVDENA